MTEPTILDCDDPNAAVDLEAVAANNVIATVQAHRLKLLLGDGGYSKEELKLLEGLASTALSEKRIVSEDLNSAADREIAASLARNIGRVHGNPFLVNDGDKVVFKPPVIPDIETVPEETSQTLSDLEYVG